ncbi:MAG: HAD-IIB family hydrolase [Phycisphaerales bacterium]|nr:HAD-IIB family hydrolase [Phycisphaerales bacterium]
MSDGSGRYIMLVSVHGRVRGSDMELGVDPDTGGQITYVVELAKALIEHSEVDRVDLVTRRLVDPKLDSVYGEKFEELAPGANIVRIECGPRRYLAKESLWPHLDSFSDNLLRFLRNQGRVPDLIHGHYADAGYVAARLSSLLGIPMAFTGHSLGRVKKQRLLDQGTTEEAIEKRYRITRRIEAEEYALDNANFVVTSTHQEVEEQYALYDNYQPGRMTVIPPAVDLSRFTPPPRSWRNLPKIQKAIAPFLEDWAKPMILAVSRPDPRKNISALIKAFGENQELRDRANLVVVAGNRTDINQLDRSAREVVNEILYYADLYNLYGKIAYPKNHQSTDVPHLYQLAAKTKGVFVNPALTEPFGLTLLESAASGLPIVATSDGGPRDIVALCKNGVLIDPLDTDAIGKALLDAISDRGQWNRWSRSGLRGAHRHYSWSAHVSKFVNTASAAIRNSHKRQRPLSNAARLITADRIVVCDIDNTLVGDKGGLRELIRMLKDVGSRVAFGIATGRSLELTLSVLQEWKIPTPQLLITSVGSAIHYGAPLIEDRGFEQHIRYRWRPDAIREAMADVPGLKPQGPEGQSEYKISFDMIEGEAPSVTDVIRHLRRSRIQAKVIASHGAYLDILPIRASKGMALRYFAMDWGVGPDRCLVAGDSGNDEEMLTGNTLGVVVGNHDPELEKLRGEPHIYFAEKHYAWGIIEGIEHYDFFGQIRTHEPEFISNV